MRDHPPHSLPSELLGAVSASGQIPVIGYHVRLLSGLSTLVGETHLVGIGDEVRVFSRASLLAPFDELTAVTGVRVARSPLRTELAIEHAAGTDRVALGYREAYEIETLLREQRGEPLTEGEASARELDIASALPEAPAVSTTEEQSPELIDQRKELLDALAQKALPSGPPFDGLLDHSISRASRRVLLEARFDLERGNVKGALTTLQDGARSPRWHVRIALAELLLRENRAKEALVALDEAQAAEAPAERWVPLRELAARIVGSRRQLLTALRGKRELLVDRAERGLADAEIGAIEASIAKDREAQRERQEQNAARTEARKRERADEKRLERSTRPPRERREVSPRKVKQLVDKNIVTLEPPGTRALRNDQPKAEVVRKLSAAAPPEKSTTTLLVIALVLAALVAFVGWMQVRSRPHASDEVPVPVGPTR